MKLDFGCGPHPRRDSRESIPATSAKSTRLIWGHLLGSLRRILVGDEEAMMSAYPKAIDPKDQDEVEHDFRAALGFSYWTPGEKHECVRTEIGSGAYTLGCSYCQQPWPCPTVHEASLIEGTGVK